MTNVFVFLALFELSVGHFKDEKNVIYVIFFFSIDKAERPLIAVNIVQVNQGQLVTLIYYHG